MIADELLNGGFKCTEIENKIQTDLLKVVEEWSQVMVKVNVDEDDVLEGSKEWEDFEQLTKHLNHWIDVTKHELEAIDRKIKRSSVETLKHCFHDITVDMFPNN